MKAGKLRERIQLLAPTASTDAAWGRTGDAFAVYDTVSAEVTPQRSDEVRTQDAALSTTRYQIRMRYRAGVLQTHRITWKGKTLEIVGAVNVEGRNRELLIDAVEVVKPA